MKPERHIAPNRLKALLAASHRNSDDSIVIDHVESCRQCQNTLERLAAEPRLWKRVSTMMASLDDGEARVEPGSLGRSGPWKKPESDEDDLPGNLFDTPSHPEMLGRIGTYEVEREIGRGGMGIVFKAFDAELNRPVAIKLLSPRLAKNGTARRRFTREARAAAAVLHPNVVSIYGVDCNHKTPYLVMPYIAGPSLQRFVDTHGPLEEKELVRVALQVSAGLSAAHSQGLVHRDIKPANILTESDVSRILVTDFGLARTANDVSMTQSDCFVGTPNYMSPEQAEGNRVDARSDLFSLGSVMYFLATGHMPFRAPSPLSVLNRISNDVPTPIQQVNNEISDTLCDIIDKLLSKDVGDRFQSASELHQVLERYLVYLHQPDGARPPIIVGSKRRKSVGGENLKPILIVSSAICLVTLLLGIFIGKGGLGRPGQRPVEGTRTDWERTQRLSPNGRLPVENQARAVRAAPVTGSESHESTLQKESGRRQSSLPQATPAKPASPVDPVLAEQGNVSAARSD